MTAPEPGSDHEASRRPPLAPGASPRAIAASLLGADRTEFLAEYDRLVERARVDLDLTEVLDMLEHWRGVAVLQADPQRFARNVRRAAERITGRPIPDDEPLEVTRGKAGA